MEEEGVTFIPRWTPPDESCGVTTKPQLPPPSATRGIPVKSTKDGLYSKNLTGPTELVSGSPDGQCALTCSNRILNCNGEDWNTCCPHS